MVRWLPARCRSSWRRYLRSVVVDGPFQTENGEQIGEPENDIIRRYQPTAAAYLKKRYIFVLLQIM